MPRNPFRPDSTPPATPQALRNASRDYSRALADAQTFYARAQSVASRLPEPVELPILDWQSATAAGAILAKATAPPAPAPKRHIRYVGPDGTVRTMWCEESYARMLLRDRQGEVIDDLGELEPAKEFQQHGSPQYATAPTMQGPGSTVPAGRLISGPQ